MRGFGLEFGIRVCVEVGVSRARPHARKGQILYFSVGLCFRKIIRTVHETEFFISEWPNISAVPHLREQCAFQRKACLKDPLYGQEGE